MSDCDGNTGTSSAITEKKQSNRGGGCVGILFQLFDWHRKFAKKQLFKRKLLPPPAVAKQVVKKFKGDEKMPAAKLHLITDENKVGFPSMRKNGSRNVDAKQKHERQAPGLVARLMGLETMPLVNQKVKKNPPPETCNEKREKLLIGSRVLRKKDLNEEKGDMKQVLRPPKLQETGESDKRVFTRFGGEALQMKNVLSRSWKHHPHKLVTPVKSPRITPTKNVSQTSSRLIDAATKILEPGLQNKRRTKCALPYSSSPQHASVELEMAEKSQFTYANMQSHAVTSENLANGYSMGQFSCKKSGNLLDIMDCRPIMQEELCNHNSISPRHFDDSCQGNGMDRQRLDRSNVVPQKTIFHKGRHQEYLAAGSLSECHDGGQIKDVKSLMESWDGWPTDCQKHNPYGDEKAVEERIMNGYLKGRSASRSLCVTSNNNKDFVTPNQRMSSRTRTRSPVTAKGSEMDVARTRTRRSEYLSEMKPPLLKMRSSIEHPTSAIPLLAQQKSRSELPGTGNRARCSENDSGVVSLTFQSTVNYNTGYSEEGKNKRQGPGGFDRKTVSRIKSVLGENQNDGLQQKHFALSGVAPVAFLEEKLKGITSQEEATISCKMSRRSTTVNKEESLPEYGATADSKRVSQAKPSIHNAAKVLPDVNTLSSRSTLEASFSIDSCVSSSCDDVSGSKLNAHRVNYSFDSSRAIFQDMELLDSASSFSIGGTHFIELTSLIGRVASMMDNLSDGRSSGSKVKLAKEIILNAELLFASFSPRNSQCLEDVICALLQVESAEVKALFKLGDAEVGSEMKAFTLDCLLECFDKGYRRYCNFGYKGWVKQLSSWSPEMLSLDIVNEVQRWAGLSGLTPDEIIENDMSHSIGKWIDFDIETFELGAAFADDILADVMEEIVEYVLCPAH